MSLARGGLRDDTFVVFSLELGKCDKHAGTCSSHVDFLPPDLVVERQQGSFLVCACV